LHSTADSHEVNGGEKAEFKPPLLSAGPASLQILIMRSMLCRPELGKRWNEAQILDNAEFVKIRPFQVSIAAKDGYETDGLPVAVKHGRIGQWRRIHVPQLFRGWVASLSTIYPLNNRTTTFFYSVHGPWNTTKSRTLFH